MRKTLVLFALAGVAVGVVGANYVGAQSAVAGPNNPTYWANRLGFSPEQYAAMARLEKSTGVTQCNEIREEISRKYGLPGNTDPKAFEAANKGIVPALCAVLSE